jgi:DNA polymerase
MVKKKITVKESILACTNCELHKVGNGPIPYRGRPSPIMVLGEAPGRREDEQGKPFVGPAGRLLWQELKRVGIEPRDVMAANAVCCWPQRTPTGNEIYACRGNLYDQIRRCHPSYILALGKTVNWSLGKQKTPMGELRGTWYNLAWFISSPGFEPGERIPVLPTLHPAAVLRNKTLLRKWRADLTTFSDKALA